MHKDPALQLYYSEVSILLWTKHKQMQTLVEVLHTHYHVIHDNIAVPRTPLVEGILTL